MKKIQIFLTLFLFSFVVDLQSGSIHETKEVYDLPLNKINLWKNINQSGIKFPEIAFAQALLESGDLTSTLCRLHNNIFGMKVPVKRESLAIGISKGGYAKYNHWTTSVQDYFLFQNYVFRNRDYSKKEYLVYLGKFYSHTPDYIKRVERVLRENSKIIELT